MRASACKRVKRDVKVTHTANNTHAPRKQDIYLYAYGTDPRCWAAAARHGCEDGETMLRAEGVSDHIQVVEEYYKVQVELGSSVTHVNETV